MAASACLILSLDEVSLDCSAICRQLTNAAPNHKPCFTLQPLGIGMLLRLPHTLLSLSLLKWMSLPSIDKGPAAMLKKEEKDVWPE